MLNGGANGFYPDYSMQPYMRYVLLVKCPLTLIHLKVHLDRCMQYPNTVISLVNIARGLQRKLLLLILLKVIFAEGDFC